MKYVSRLHYLSWNIHHGYYQGCLINAHWKTEHTRQELNEAHRDGDSDGRQK